MDDAHDVYEQWDKVVHNDGDVIDHIDNDVQVVSESTLEGLTTKWDQPLQVSPTVAMGTAEVKVSPTDTGRPTREHKSPNTFIPSWKGNKYGYAMTQIVQLDGRTVEESVAFMQQELQEAGEHHWP